jgi:hypothetical protein
VRARIWEHAADQRVWMRVLNPYVDIVSTTFDGRLSVDAIAFSLPGMFAILAVGLAGLVIALGTALTAAPFLWVLTAVFLFFASFPADTVREAEQLKTRDVQNAAGIDAAAYVLAHWSRRVVGPRLVVLRVVICRHDRALQIAAAAASVSPSSFDDDMGRLLEMEEILAYTTDRSGIKRFASALRGTLLSRSA